MCSSKCDMPCSSARSSRLPAPIHTPRDAVCKCGIASLTTTRPEGRHVTSTLMQRLPPVRNVGEPFGNGRLHLAGSFDRLRELRRMCGAKHHHGYRRIACLLLADGYGNRSMWIDELPGLPQHGPDCCRSLLR